MNTNDHYLPSEKKNPRSARSPRTPARSEKIGIAADDSPCFGPMDIGREWAL